MPWKVVLCNCSVCFVSCHSEIFFKYEYGSTEPHDEEVMGNTSVENKRLLHEKKWKQNRPVGLSLITVLLLMTVANN